MMLGPNAKVSSLISPLSPTLLPRPRSPRPVSAPLFMHSRNSLNSSKCPLYGINRTTDSQDGDPIVITEGEKPVPHKVCQRKRVILFRPVHLGGCLIVDEADLQP